MSATLFERNQPLDSASEEQSHVFVSVDEGEPDCTEVCTELLGALELNEVSMLRHQQLSCGGDGSDSGVEIATNSTTVPPLHRALSNNSGGGYASSNGLDETTTTQGLNNMSCDSSMISCNSDSYEMKVGSRVVKNYECCCSENGSESSSIATARPTVAASCNRSNSVKLKVAMFEPGGMQHNSGAHKLARGAKERDFSESAASTTSAAQLHGVSQIRPRMSTIKRTASLPRPSLTSNIQTREKQSPNSGKPAFTTNTTTPFRTTTPARATKLQKPDSLPTVLSRTQSISMQRLVQRTPSLSRARTPGTPSDDGRWPGPGITHSRAMATAKRGLSVTPDLSSLKARTGMTSMDSKSNVSNPYGTVPRRRKQKSVEDLTARPVSRSSSISRESRMTSSVVLSSRKNLVSSYGEGSTAATATTPTQAKMLPPSSNTFSAAGKNASLRKLQQTKTRIYHEVQTQTALTSNDLEQAFQVGSTATRPVVDAAEQCDQQTQSDLRDHELERLRDEVRQFAHREHELSAKLQREREEKLAMQQELHLNTERVMGMLELARVAGGTTTPTSEEDGGGSGHDSLLMLESQIQMSGHELTERQQEIDQLRQLCRSLKLETKRSLVVQECLLQEKAIIEQESNEMQDFLQHEKAAMCDALKDLEAEYHVCKQQLASREEEVKVLRDECRHLVRLNEQRRQENRLLQTKCGAFEAKSKELIIQQNSSVSGASAALSGLQTRLDSLVEQLVSSYNISEQDLEDIGFQHETQTNNGDESQITHTTTTNGLDLESVSLHQYNQHTLSQPSDGSLSPQRNQSFIAAVISAIRNATTPAGKRLLARHGHGYGNNGKHAHADAAGNHQCNNNNHNDESCNGDDSDSTEMLDSETEPCLMMDNVLEDVTMPDSHSHNMVSSCTTGGMISQIEIPSELVNVTTGDESLHNLSQAITNRQQMELQINAMNVQKVALLQLNAGNSISEDISCHDSVAEISSLVEYSSIQAVMDQVIEVDSLVTKLLKVLRLIQMDNDNCIQQLIVDKNKLQQNKEDMLEKLKDLQDVNMKLQDDLMDATQELMIKNTDLSSTKAEMQRHRNEIDVRF